MRVKIRGIVHGVSFRASMAMMATDLGVRGWVKNLPDGTVEAFLEGDDRSVGRVIDWARVGPPRARVDCVATQDAAPRNYKGFRIR